MLIGSKYQVSDTGHGCYITPQEAPGDPVTNYDEAKVMWIRRRRAILSRPLVGFKRNADGT